jgi:hypothetical protein
MAMPISAQEVSTHTTVTGTVVSYSKNTLTVRSEDGHYRLFLINRDTVKPKDLATGSQVRVTSTPTDDPAVRLAIAVATVQPGAAPTAGEEQADVVPESVRKAESAIQREAKRFRFGFQGGVGLDPEVIDFGIHAKFGPFFTKNLLFRPSVDFAYGEVTRLFALNAEAIYRMPYTVGAKAYVYFGGGPQFNFIEQKFEQGEAVNFSDFHYSTALNILLGVQHRSGMFAEVKTSIYASPAPVIRLMVGYSF